MKFSGKSNAIRSVEAFSEPTSHEQRSSMTSRALVRETSTVLTSSGAAFLAKTSRAPAEALASRVLEAASGSKCFASFANYDPASSSLKTSRLSLFEVSTPSSLALPRAGLMLSGSLYELPTLEHRIVESGSSWSRGEYPTPTAEEYGSSQNGVNADRPTAGTPSLSTWAKDGWSTPTASDCKRGRVAAKRRKNSGGGARTLTYDVAAWPTPTASDAKASGAADYSTESGRHEGITLTDAAVRSPPDHLTSKDGAAISTRAVLNPRFVEALMGFPDGWITSVPPVMRSCRKSRTR